MLKSFVMREEGRGATHPERLGSFQVLVWRGAPPALWVYSLLAACTFCSRRLGLASQPGWLLVALGPVQGSSPVGPKTIWCRGSAQEAPWMWCGGSLHNNSNVGPPW